MPTTRLGRAAAWLLLAFVALLSLFFVLIESGQRGGATFFSNPWLALAGLAAATTAVAAGVVAVVAIVARRERSVLVAVAALVGLLVALWVGLEVAFPHSIA